MGKQVARCEPAPAGRRGSRGGVRAAGRTGRRGPGRARAARQRAHGRLPDRRLGRREPGLPRVHRRPRSGGWATRCWPAGSAWSSTGRSSPSRLVKAVWTDDVAMSTRINPTSPTTPARSSWPTALEDGLEARRAGDDATATSRLGRAAQLAAESGNDGTLQLLARVVDIEDAAIGHGPAQPQRRRRRRDGARHPLDEDGAGEAGVNDRRGRRHRRLVRRCGASTRR